MGREGSTRPQAPTRRLFVAVDVPEAAEVAIEAAVAPIRAAFPDARWAPLANRHVTMKFLGSTPVELVGWVHETVAGVAAAHAPVPTALTGLGSFPSPRRTRVLWVGLDDRAGALAAIAGALDAAFAARVRPEARPFAAHLTVARSDPPLRLAPGTLSAPVAPVRFVVARLVLYRSHLGRPAPRYEPLGTFPLPGSG